MEMTNELLFILSIFFYMSSVLVLYKLFGRTGLYIWTALAVIMANLEAAKMVNMFGLESSLGNAVYASGFLVTDILSEKYGKKYATRAVNVGLVVTFIWVIFSQQIMWFIPNSQDFVSPHFNAIFGLSGRLAMAGIFTYAVSQRVDVILYEKWWNYTARRFRSKEKFLWLRNNGSTLVSQLLDTIIFTIIAFVGVFPMSTIVNLIWVTYIFKVITNVLDTPFLYLAKRIKPMYY